MIMQIPFNIGVDCKVLINTLIQAPWFGKWTYNGYSTSSAGPFNMTPATPLFSGYSAGSILYGGESNFYLNPKGKTNGFYSLTYNYSGGSTDLVLQIIDDDFCVAEDQTITLSSSGAPVDLTAYLNDATCGSYKTGGTWVDLDSSGALTGSSFDPATAGIGTWTIEYYYQEQDFQETSCCDTSIVLTINVGAGYGVSLAQADTTCTYEIGVEHPGTSVVNDVALVMDTAYSVDFPVIQLVTRVTDSCGGADVVSATQTYATPHLTVTGVGSVNPDNALVSGGWIEYVTVYSTTLGATNIPLAPSGANIATMTGSGGTTNASALTFNGTDRDSFATALGIAFRNYMIDVLGLVSGTDFNFYFFSIDSVTLRPYIFMGLYHGAPADFAGLQRASAQLVYKYDGVNTQVSNTYYVSTTSTFAYGEYSASPCPSGANKLTWRSNSVSPASFYDSALTDYDNFELTTATLSLTVNSGASNVDHECDAKTLTASSVNCTGVETWLWSSGETTAAVTKLVGAGSFTVTGSCTIPADSDDETIIV